jgi:hypothetical protein
MKHLLVLLGFLLLPLGALAQSTATPVVTGYNTTVGCPNGLTVCFVQYGSTGPPSTVTPVTATTTPTGSSVTTHLVFQQALAANSSRKGCLIANTSSDTELVYFGATGSATTTNSIPIAAGASINCASGLIVASDNIAITSKATDGATYVVNAQ